MSVKLRSKFRGYDSKKSRPLNYLAYVHFQWVSHSDVNKDWTHNDQDKDKDQSHKDKD